MNSSHPVVQVERLGAELGRQRILEDVDLSVRPHETIAVIGPSGAGKTTLLRCINFLIPYDTGRVYLSGELVGYRDERGKLVRRRDKEIIKQRAQIGIVFQRFNLFPHRTVLGNLIEGPVHVLGIRKEVARSRALEALERVGLSEKAHVYPIHLSGGQQQRVAIARALCMQPKVLLFDEVTSALDPELVAEVLAVMRQLSEDGMTMIVVTHELRFARRSADRVVFMERGRVITDTATDEFFERPPSDRIASYIADF